MFENYQATTKDLRAIEEGISVVWRKELDFIFQDKSKIEKTLVISYDAKNIYVWTGEKKSHQLLKISHQLKIKDEDQWGWRAGLRPKEMINCLPKRWQGSQFDQPIISGGLLTPFVELQKIKAKKHPLNPYTTHEGYLSTIVHEFGHIYYHQHKLWWYSDKEENLNYLNRAHQLYEENSVSKKDLKVRIPSYKHFSELFAFCADYTAASIFWPLHKKEIDSYYSDFIPKLVIQEKDKNLHQQDSVLEEDPHNFAGILGKLILEHYPKKWPRFLLQGFVL